MNWLGNSKQSGTESRKQSTGYARKRTESLMVYSRPLALMIFSTQTTDNIREGNGHRVVVLLVGTRENFMLCA